MARRGRPRHPDVLTPRQWEVLGHLRDGLSNPEIASELGITRAGVKFHVAEILGKLEVSSREDAARWQPVERRRWWATALAPMGWAFRQMPSPPISWSNAAAALAGGVVATGVAGIAVVGYLLVQGGGANSLSPPSELVGEPTATAPPISGTFEGELGDFLVLDRLGERAEEAVIYDCPSGSSPLPVTDPVLLRSHELWSDAFGPNGIGWGCGRDEIHLVNDISPESADDPAAVRMTRAYFQALPMPVVRDAPLDRPELIEIEGHPALILQPLEGAVSFFATLTVIERFPAGDVPGIVVSVALAPSSEEAIALAEALMP